MPILLIEDQVSGEAEDIPPEIDRFFENLGLATRADREVVIDEDERLIYVRHYDNELNITTQLRWWLVQTDDGWRIYDFEELSVGLRVVNLMGTMIGNGAGANPQPWFADFIEVAQKIQTVDFTDVDSFLTLDEPTEKLHQHDLPPDIKRFASMMHSSILQIKGDAEGSIAELQAALEGGYIGPLYHYRWAMHW